MFDLSVIIPFRCENSSADYLIKRLRELINILPKDIPQIEYILVDSGSNIEFSKICQDICFDKIKYLFHESRGKTFSLSNCRDFGAQHARGKAVTFLDVDLRMPPTFWIELLSLMKNWGISDFKTKFLAVPCYIYHKKGLQFLLVLKKLKINIKNSI